MVIWVYNIRKSQNNKNSLTILIDIYFNNFFPTIIIKKINKQMNKMLSNNLFVIIFLLSAICYADQSVNWDNWVLPDWQPFWDYDLNWTAPNPPLNFSRNNIGYSLDPSDNYYPFRANHYLW
jgi:hypothetical protein